MGGSSVFLIFLLSFKVMDNLFKGVVVVIIVNMILVNFDFVVRDVVELFENYYFG